MHKPLFTIITVCYNAETSIRRTLESVAKQTYPHIQHLVVDGASQDDTLDVVRRLNPKVEIHSEADRGIYDAMNKGLRLAQGEYICYINAGDALYDADTISNIVSLMEQGESPDVIYGDCMLIDELGHELGLRRLRPPRSLSWRSFKEGMLVCHQSFIARRSLCPEYDMRYRLSADVDWCIRVMQRAKHFLRIDAPISRYLHEGATTANHRRSLIERFHIMRKYYGLATTLYQHLRFALVRQR